MTSTDDNVTFTQAAAGLGITPATFSARVRLKGFKGRKSPNHRHAKLISRTELEALVGYRLTDAQWEAAKTVTHKRKTRTASTLNLDWGWVRFGWEFACDAWRRHLLAHGIDHIASPPFPSELETRFAERNIFTRSEVYDLLESCVKQRDAQWDDWITDSVHRAQFPNGPELLEFKYPPTVED